jgi:hypothetical protein
LFSAKYRAISPNDVDGSAYISNINRAIFAVAGSGIIIFVRMPWRVVGSSLKPKGAAPLMWNPR